MKILNFSGSFLSLQLYLSELLFNSTGLLVRSWLILHITLAMFSKFPVHGWSQGGVLMKDILNNSKNEFDPQ